MINSVSGINAASAIGAIPGQGGGGLGNIADAGSVGGAGEADGASFSDALSQAVLKRPSQSQAKADELAAMFAAGGNVDPHQLAIATAKAGVEIQMSTRAISQAVTAVRTLFQMQI